MNPQAWRRRFALVGVGLLAFGIVSATLWYSSRWINQPFPGFFLYRNLTVSPDYLARWTGAGAGLHPFDRIVAVEDRPVGQSQEVYHFVRGAPPHSAFRYTVEREGQTFFLTVPSMRFSILDWLLSFGIYLIVGAGFAAIGIAPLYFHSAAPAAVPLFLMTSSVFLWFGMTFDFLTTQFFPKELRILAFALTPGAGIHLGLSLTRGSPGLTSRRILALIYGASFLLAGFYTYTFYGPWDAWRWALRVGYLYGWLASLVFLGLLWARLRRPASELERSRLRVIGAGAVFGFFLPTSGAVLAHLAGWALPHNLILVPAVFFPLCVAYALLQYNLFEIDNILKIGLTRAAHTGILLTIYVLIVFFLNIATTIDDQSLLVPLFFSVLVVLVFNPVLRRVERAIDRYFYRKEYDRAGLQGEVSSLLRTLSRPERVAEKWLRTLIERMGIEKACCFFHPEEQRRPVALSGDEERVPARPSELDWNSRAVRYLEVRRSGIARDEVENDPGHRDYCEELLEVFRDLEAVLLLPVVFEDAVIGLVSLGPKRSGMGYSSDDFRLLSNLTDQFALALKNGVLFEESEKTKESYQLLYGESQAANRKLVEMDQLKKQFVANISHELRTPISTILGYAEVLLDRPFQGDEKLILERVVTNGRDLTHLMDSLLDFARIESGPSEIHRQRVNLRDLVHTLQAMMERLLKARPVRFQSRVDTSVEIIETDGKKLHQILMHLLTNALKFTREGEIELNVERSSDRGPGWVRISVSDTGIGIPQGHLETIFEEFRQLDGSSTRQYGGAGLGLTLCRKLAQSLGAALEVESAVGEGSTFSLILPAPEAHPNVIVRASAATLQESLS